MRAYDRKAIRKSPTFKRLKKYVVKGKRYSKEEKIRFFFSRAEGTIAQYVSSIRGYVRYMHREERREAFPVTETSLRRYINYLDIEKDKGKFVNLKAAVCFTTRIRNEQDVSFRSLDFILEGVAREVGARFRPEFKIDKVNELNIRKLILRALYGKSFREPYNSNMSEFRTGLRCLTSLMCLSRCEDFMELKKIDIKFDPGNVIIAWRKRKNNQKSKPQQSSVPRLDDHPLCLFRAFGHYFAKTRMQEQQFVNCKLSCSGKAMNGGITRSTCYANIRKLCDELRIPSITEKMCKSLGTR